VGRPYRTRSANLFTEWQALRWTPAGDGLTYISNADSSSNLWLQPLSGAAPKRLTDFRDDEFSRFRGHRMANG
jgi:Tol biopolymer transport system component